MKFKPDTTWKHKNGRDAFIRVRYTSRDTGTEATLVIEWWIQGVELCGLAPVNGPKAQQHLAALHIKPEQYPNWEPYEPRGTYS